MNIIEEINKLKRESGETNPNYVFTHGKCYEFAKKLKETIGGEIVYLIGEEHAVVKLGDKIYDVTGNVTNAYKESRRISEEEMLHRYKYYKGNKGVYEKGRTSFNKII